mmetsp:Transcript_3426/g.5048  ORF Transcript_3426/g.5048 Transcript_3426/m.5048 type:complete len:136 (+) Transcript_3426:173-580(+)
MMIVKNIYIIIIIIILIVCICQSNVEGKKRVKRRDTFKNDHSTTEVFDADGFFSLFDNEEEENKLDELTGKEKIEIIGASSIFSSFIVDAMIICFCGSCFIMIALLTTGIILFYHIHREKHKEPTYLAYQSMMDE